MSVTESEYVYVRERETRSLLVSLPIGVDRARMCVCIAIKCTGGCVNASG